MRKNIPVKYGVELIILVSVALMPMLYSTIKNPTLSGILLACTLICFILVCFLGIRYYIENETLYVKNGLFGTKKIPVSEISEIRKSSSMISAAAPSISGRIQIKFGNSEVIISPKNYADFKKALLQINPSIKFDD